MTEAIQMCAGGNDLMNSQASNALVGESVQKSLLKASGIVAVLIAALNDGLTLDPLWTVEQLQQISTAIQAVLS